MKPINLYLHLFLLLLLASCAGLRKNNMPVQSSLQTTDSTVITVRPRLLPLHLPAESSSVWLRPLTGPAVTGRAGTEASQTEGNNLMLRYAAGLTAPVAEKPVQQFRFGAGRSSGQADFYPDGSLHLVSNCAGLDSQIALRDSTIYRLRRQQSQTVKTLTAQGPLNKFLLWWFLVSFSVLVLLFAGFLLKR